MFLGAGAAAEEWEVRISDILCFPGATEAAVAEGASAPEEAPEEGEFGLVRRVRAGRLGEGQGGLEMLRALGPLCRMMQDGSFPDCLALKTDS